MPLPSDDAPPDTTTISLADALAAVARRFGPATGIETVALDSALGRILAADMVAPLAVPAADNSAVDGYAVRHADLEPQGETRFYIAGIAAAGRPYADKIGAGETVRIFTGAILPEGADTVVPQEDATAAGSQMIVPAGLRLGDNRRLAGEDMAAGSCVLRAGDRLGPAALGILASLGFGAVSVRSALRVAVFSTGDELRPAPAPIGRGQIHDSNRPVLLAMLKTLGIAATDLGILPDKADIIRARLGEAARDHDAVICSAGMSVGDEDHVKSAVRAQGALDFWSVAIKPGRPVAIGRIGDTPFFGLPGNPVAMVVTFAIIVRPALLLLAGARPRPPRRFPVTADFAVSRRTGKREFLRCILDDAGGVLLARKFPRGGSGVLSSIAGSEGLLEIAEDIAEIAPGRILPFIPFSALGL